MPWFGVLWRTKSPHPDYVFTMIELTLIEARSAKAALAKATQKGKDEECSYLNEDGETVTWHFAGIEGCYQVPDASAGSGTIVYIGPDPTCAEPST